MLFSKTLRFNVSKILIDVIRRIDGISIALPGLDEWERSTQSRASVMSECNSLYNNILPMFICAQCDVERLRTVALESCHAAIRSCVRRACLRIEAHMGELGDLLQFCGGWTCRATTNEWPPPLYYLANKSTVYMEETLACASVPIEELRCLLGWEGTPLCGQLYRRRRSRRRCANHHGHTRRQICVSCGGAEIAANSAASLAPFKSESCST